MRKILAALALAVALAAPGGARAVEAWSGPWLHDACNSSDAAAYQGCVGYLQGFVAGGLASHGLHDPAEPDPFKGSFASGDYPFCLPEGFSGNDLAKVVGSWTASHPQMRGEWAPVQVIGALTSAFPCK